ncbi:hypothetical protein CBS76997_4162 [Aspergillus niger]|nr:hypothetical protein CBS13152_591 [Aspergillus niger]KAI3046290.1 hypothetical protein CBS76997_4162 [Aspergillus niger]
MTTSLWARALSALPDKDQRMFRTSGTASTPVSQTLADITTAIETQRDRCKRHRWSTISIGGKELIIRDVCAKIVACVNKFASVVDVVVSYDPVHAALPWAGVRFVLQLFLNGIDTFGAIVEGLETSVRVIARGGILEGLYYQKNSALSEARQALQDEIVKCYTAVLKFLSLARKYYQCSRMKRAVNFIISKDDLRHCTKEIQIAEQQFLIQKGLADSEDLGNIETNVLHTILIATSTADQVNDMKTKLEKALLDLDKPLIRVVDQVSDLHRSLKDNERAQILRWISPVPAQEHYREASASLMPGSGEWLFRHPEFQAWRDSSSSEVLWLHGIPGCGKSKIAAAVIRHLRLQASKVQHSLPIVHFFCSTNPAEPERSDAREILRSLIKQLSLSVSKDLMRTPVVEEYRKRLQEATYYGEGPAALSVERCTELLCELGQSAPIMLIIDALDECDSQQRTILQQSLEEMRQSCRDLVKIFVSSRYEEDIATGFRHKRTLCVTPHDTEDDLRHFIDLHVSRFVSRWAVLHSEASDKLQQLEKSLKETLNTGAQGMFLWVSLQLECISDTSRVKDLESIYEALGSLPATLGRSYAAIHCRIESMKETAREVARFTFYWLLGAKRMLPIPDFLIAVARSAKYLESLEIYRGKEVSYSIALGCLDAYLGENCVENEFLKYATNYWPSHVEDLGFAPQRAMVVPSLTEFFTKEEHFDDWLDNFELQQREGGSSWKSTNERKLDASISTPRTPLFLICCFGFVEILEDDDVVEDLDVNQTNKDGSSGLYLAARGGHIMVVQKLLDMGASIDAPGFNALRAAVYAGHQSIVQRLLETGAKLNPQELQFADCCARRALSLTALTAPRDALPNVIKELRGLDTLSHLGPLELAAQRGNVILLEMLLVEAARINSSKAYSGLLKNSTLALQIAAFWGHSPAVKCLLAHGVDINAVQRKTGTAFQAALEGEQYLVAELLLSKGADIDRHWMEFGSCLQVFSERGNLEAVEFLLDQGADINDAGGKNGNALQVACGAGHAEVAHLLLQKGADVNAPGKAIGTALYAASANGNIRIVELLLRQGAIQDISWNNFQASLEVASENGSFNIVEMLLDHVKADHIGSNFDADINIALQAAWANGHLDIVKMLLDRGIEVHDTMLCKAAENGNTDLIQLLLGRGACVNPQTKHCQSTNLEENRPIDDVYSDTSPLHLAAFNGHETAVSCLLDSGADIQIQRPLRPTGTGRNHGIMIFERSMSTPLQAACYKGHAYIARRLFVHDPWGYIEHQTFTSALQISLEHSQHEVASILLSEAIHVGFNAEIFSEIFRHSCSKGYKNFVVQILEHFTVINWPDGLLEAAEHGRAGTVGVLLSRGADVETRNGSGESAISLAVNKMKIYGTGTIYEPRAYLESGEDAPDYMRTLATLINAGHALDDSLSVNMSHLVRCTVRTGRLDILTALESSGFSIFQEPGIYSEALILASSRRRAEMLRYLLSIRTTIRPEALSVQPTENKAEEQPTFRGPSKRIFQELEPFIDYTGVMLSLSQHDLQVAHLIKEPFKEAMHSEHVECVRVFIDLFTKDGAHRAAICTGVLSLTLPSVELLTFLLNQGADPDTRHFETGETLLHRAAARGDENALQSILSSSPHISLQSGEQGTALHAAVVRGFYGAAELILRSGADVDAPCTLLGTPLAAVMAQSWETFRAICHRSCAELLLDWGADADSFDQCLGTPIDIAYKAGNREGVELLLERGALDPRNHGVSHSYA